MRKITAAVIVMALLLGLSACGSRDSGDAVITINGSVDITSDIFRYYLKSAMTADEGLTDKDYIEIATNESIRYAAVNSRFSRSGMKLTASQRAEISKNTNVLWRQFGDYYTGLGLTKETFYKLKTSEEYRESIRFSLFDTGGELAVDENSIRAQFNEMYVGFRFVYDYLYDADEYGNAVKKSEDEINVIYNDYLSAATAINNNGSNLEEAYASFASDEAYNSHSLDTVIIGENNTFPAGFYDTVKKSQINQATVIISDDYLYLVVRDDILATDSDYYENYRKESLIRLTDSLLDSEIASWAGEYKAVRQYDKAQKCLADVRAADAKFR